MRPNRHRIQRQVIDLAVTDSQQAPSLQHAMARSFWDRAVPELEKVFDRAAGPDRRLRLDRLELDLGRIEGFDWESQFHRKLVDELTRSLAQFSASPASEEHNGATAPASEAWESFLFFLVQGRLPWWCAKPEGDWSALLVQSSGAANWRALQQTIATDVGARARLVHFASDDLLDLAVFSWSGVPEAAQVLDQLTPTVFTAAALRRWRHGFWTIVLEWILSSANPAAHGAAVVRRLFALRQTLLFESERRRQAAPPGNEQAEPFRPRTVEDLPDPWRGWQIAQPDAEGFDEPAIERSAEPAAAVKESPEPSSTGRRNARKADRPAEQDDAVYVEGGGVVLLHPFIERLFRERGLLHERAFRDREARDRAVQLLGWLTFGRDDIPEYELVLAKLLCGVPLEEPVEMLPLDEDDQRACDELLRAVLEHWTALRSTSPAWLREQFFLRDGKLERVDSGYRLTIERRAQDVLLARLPWGCGVIGLPWLEDRIFVHWLE